MIKPNQFLVGSPVKLFSLIILFILINLANAEGKVAIDKVTIDLSDKVSLQRGAKLFFNYCMGCHGAKFVRYNTMAKDLGIVDEEGNILDNIMQKYIMMSEQKKITDLITANMQPADGEKWFGIAPPDLSLVAKSRGINWLYTYLRSFYQDPKRPLGVNNLVYPGTAMPHVLWQLQGILYLPELNHGIELKSEYLKVAQPGLMTRLEYDRAITDLVNFMAYISEPISAKRHYLGIWVLLFMTFLILFTYLLKREYWKDVH